MSRTLRRASAALAVALTALTVGGTVATAQATPAAPHARTAHAVPAKGVGDRCLVGTWRDGNFRGFSVTWNGTRVAMHGGAGAIERDYKSGSTTTNMRRAKAFYGTYRGHRLKLVQRGTYGGIQHADKATHHLAFEGLRDNTTLTFTYRGKQSKGYHGTPPWFGSSRYSCGAKAYSTPKYGTAKRISRKP